MNAIEALMKELTHGLDDEELRQLVCEIQGLIDNAQLKSLERQRKKYAKRRKS